jgi:anti-sigma factor RsiW
MMPGPMPIEVITDADIQALIDGELAPARQEVVITAISNDYLLQQRYNTLRRQKSLLLSWWVEEQDNSN